MFTYIGTVNTLAVLCMTIAGDTGYPGMKGRSGEKGDQGWLQ